MGIDRRTFLKISASSGLLLASNIEPAFGASSPKPLSPEAVGILYDATLCIGCKSCMVNCKKFNSMPGGALYSENGAIPYEQTRTLELYDAPTDLSTRSLSIVKAYKNGSGLNKDQETDGYSFVKQHCMHCLDPACVSVCPVAALHKDARTGAVVYDPDKCIGCRYCETACPFSIPRFEFESTTPRIVKCQLCSHRFAQGGYSACCEFCPTGASIFGTVQDLRAEAEQRLALKAGTYHDYPLQRHGSGKSLPTKVGKYVNHVYGRHEAGGTQYLLLAGVGFDKLGFNPRITSQAYPERTWSFIKKIPFIAAAILIAGVATHYRTRDTK